MLFRKCLTGFGNTKRYCHQLNRCRKKYDFSNVQYFNEKNFNFLMGMLPR